jgi:hypothetical protein
MTLPCFMSPKTFDVLHRVLALRLVAQVPAVQFAGKAEFVKRALLEERWADAVLAWIDRYEIAVDVSENGPDLYTEQDVGGELSGLRLQMTPLFEEPDPRNH